MCFTIQSYRFYTMKIYIYSKEIYILLNEEKDFILYICVFYSLDIYFVLHKDVFYTTEIRTVVYRDYYFTL